MSTHHEPETTAQWLAQAGSYPHRPEQVDHLETHISHVFLAGEYAYKLKKPVKYDFLDFTTLPARERACREELRLNRRLAPDAYLDVVPVRRDAAGSLQLGGDGQVVDWLVWMRRLPTELTLDALRRRGRLRPADIDRLAARLSLFYQSLAPLRPLPQDYRERYASHVSGNLRELLAARGLSPETVRRVHGFQLQLLRRSPGLVDERVRGGRIVEGHGDLRPEHICLSEPIVIFDCLEFSTEFRTIDVADELAFLAAECDFLGADWVGPQLLAAYELASGDRPPPELWAFYKAYRACVRAKVAALRAGQLGGQQHEAAMQQAQRHLRLADAYAAAWLRPLVLAIGGLSGAGKSTLAAALAEALGAALVRTDVVRQELFGVSAPTAGPAAAPVDGGVYRPEARQQVYDELARRAAALGRQRISVVLDATFSTARQVQDAHRLAADSGSQFLAVECVCRPEVARERIGRRLAAGGDPSQARPELHDLQRQRWEAWPAAMPQFRLDTEQPLPQQVEQVIAAIEG